MTFFQGLLFTTSVLLMIDTLYCIYNFHYTYFIELKRRFANFEKIPVEYKFKLNNELNEEAGMFRRMIQSSYVFWFFIVLFSKLWFLLIILSLAIFFTNLFYRKAYIAPVVLLFNLVLSLMVYMFAIINLYYKLI